MPEIETKEKRAKSSLNAFSGLLAFRCCRQTKYNSAAPKVRSNCEGQVSVAGLHILSLKNYGNFGTGFGTDYVENISRLPEARLRSSKWGSLLPSLSTTT